MTLHHLPTAEETNEDLTEAPAGRDASEARRRAEEMVEQAQRTAAAVEAYHGATDDLEDAERRRADAAARRVSSLRAMREAGQTVSTISALTGLSSSRINALLKD